MNSGQGKWIYGFDGNNYKTKLFISSEVEKVHIYANTYRQYDLYIIIQARGTNLDLYLENFAMCAPVRLNSNGTGTTYDTISMYITEPDATLNLYTYGTVSIYGSTYSKISGYNYSGSYAFYCSNLNIAAADNLKIYGGYGAGTGKNSKAILGNCTISCDENKVIIYDRA